MGASIGADEDKWKLCDPLHKNEAYYESLITWNFYKTLYWIKIINESPRNLALS